MPSPHQASAAPTNASGAPKLRLTSAFKRLALVAGCVLLAWLAAIVPAHEGLNVGGRWSLAILVFAAGMWVLEVIPAVATSLLVIGLQVAILGHPGGVFATGPRDWEAFIAPWGSPLIWLFFGGFCLAAGAEKTGLDRSLALGTLRLFGARPAMMLLGLMGVTGLMSMFVSNTATAALMFAIVGPLLGGPLPAGPLLGRPGQNDSLARALLLGIAFAASIGGMGTIIGTPPNVIAVGVLQDVVASGADPAAKSISFAQWALLAVPPATLMIVLLWAFITLAYLRGEALRPVEAFSLELPEPAPSHRSDRWTVQLVFFAAVALWFTSGWHGAPAAVVALLPVCVFTATGVLTPLDLRRIPWDILLLIAGGLSLGVAVEQTGLADWVVQQLPLGGLAPWQLVLGLCYLTAALSNLMSNTAAANIVLPLAVAIASRSDPRLIVPIALSASMAACLVISTPPNAIVFSSGRLRAYDFIPGGLLLGVAGPPIATAWCLWALRWM